MEVKKLKTNLWVVESPTPHGSSINVFNTYKQAEAFMFEQVPYLKFLTRLKNLLR